MIYTDSNYSVSNLQDNEVAALPITNGLAKADFFCIHRIDDLLLTYYAWRDHAGLKYNKGTPIYFYAIFDRSDYVDKKISEIYEDQKQGLQVSEFSDCPYDVCMSGRNPQLMARDLQDSIMGQIFE